jgi:zinc transporter ZupT
MSAIALIGGITLILREEMWQQLILPLVAFAAGSLIGGAMFHMIPGAVDKMGNVTALYVWLIAGFIVFYALEEFLHWHHSHTHSHQCNALASKRDHQHPIKPTSLCVHNCEQSKCTYSIGLENMDKTCEGNDVDVESFSRENNKDRECNTAIEVQDHDSKSQLSWLLLVADAVHNFVGGMFVSASFLDSMHLGISAWLAAAAHEIPQELGDFAILVHGGWSKKEALIFNFVSALTFPLGGVIAYLASKAIDVSFLVPFAAGNFLYIGASDLIPEIKHHHDIKQNALHFASFLAGAGIMLGIRVAFEG